MWGRRGLHTAEPRLRPQHHTWLGGQRRPHAPCSPLPRSPGPSSHERMDRVPTHTAIPTTTTVDSRSTVPGRATRTLLLQNQRGKPTCPPRPHLQRGDGRGSAPSPHLPAAGKRESCRRSSGPASPAIAQRCTAWTCLARTGRSRKTGVRTLWTSQRTSLSTGFGLDVSDTKQQPRGPIPDTGPPPKQNEYRTIPHSISPRGCCGAT